MSGEETNWHQQTCAGAPHTLQTSFCHFATHQVVTTALHTELCWCTQHARWLACRVLRPGSNQVQLRGSSSRGNSWQCSKGT
jgi:hypothetical protein